MTTHFIFAFARLLQDEIWLFPFCFRIFLDAILDIAKTLRSRLQKDFVSPRICAWRDAWRRSAPFFSVWALGTRVNSNMAPNSNSNILKDKKWLFLHQSLSKVQTSVIAACRKTFSTFCNIWVQNKSLLQLRMNKNGLVTFFAHRRWR